MNAPTINFAANSFGVSLNQSSYVTAKAGSIEYEGAIIAGYENVPVSKYHEGVDVAIIRFQSKLFGIPDGYYKFRTVADAPITKTGKQVVSTQILNEAGDVIHTWRKQVDVTSIDLPKGLQMGPLSAVLKVDTKYSKDGRGQHEFAGFRTIVCCENGMCGQCACPTDDCEQE